MNITKYGISEYCGYGFFVRGSYGTRSGFYTNGRIVARSQITTESEQILKWTPAVLLDGLPLDATHRCRIYIVFDSETGTWKEYFSGMTVNVAPDPYSVAKFQRDVFNLDRKDSGWKRGVFDVDSTPLYCDILSVSTPRECNATEFAKGVSEYSDKQIKEIVAQLNTLRSSASEWKSKFDAMVKAVKDERAAKEAGLSSVESKLASGFGKYGNNSSGGTQEEKLQWIKQGRCAFCGGEFKGLFSKVCRECGKAKNYR